MRLFRRNWNVTESVTNRVTLFIRRESPAAWLPHKAAWNTPGHPCSPPERRRSCQPTGFTMSMRSLNRFSRMASASLVSISFTSSMVRGVRSSLTSLLNKHHLIRAIENARLTSFKRNVDKQPADFYNRTSKGSAALKSTCYLCFSFKKVSRRMTEREVHDR